MAGSYTLVDAALGLATVGLYAYVGTRLGAWRHEGPARTGLVMFSAWWYGVAAFTLMGVAMGLLDRAGQGGGALPLVLAYLSMLFVCVAMWGLVYYVAYLYTGRSVFFTPSLVFYVVVYACFLYAVAQDPTGAEQAAWRASVTRLAILTGPFLSASIVAFLLPAIGAAIGYATLYRKVDSAEQKYRVVMVSLSIVGWFGSAIVARLAGFADTPWWSVVGRLIAVAVAVGALSAYAPPAWLRRWLSADPADPPSGSPAAERPGWP